MTLTTLDTHTALVLIDLQAGIVARPTAPHSGADVVKRGRELAEAFRAHGLPVVLVNVVDGAPGRTELDPKAAEDDAADGDASGDAVEEVTEDAAEGGAEPEAWDTIVADLGARAVRPAGQQAQLGRVPRHRPGHPAAPPRA